MKVITQKVFFVGFHESNELAIKVSTERPKNQGGVLELIPIPNQQFGWDEAVHDYLGSVGKSALTDKYDRCVNLYLITPQRYKSIDHPDWRQVDLESAAIDNAKTLVDRANGIFRETRGDITAALMFVFRKDEQITFQVENIVLERSSEHLMTEEEKFDLFLGGLKESYDLLLKDLGTWEEPNLLIQLNWMAEMTRVREFIKIQFGHAQKILRKFEELGYASYDFETDEEPEDDSSEEYGKTLIGLGLAYIKMGDFIAPNVETGIKKYIDRTGIEHSR